MIRDQRSALASYASNLLSEGRVVFSAEEARKALDIGQGAFLDAAERLQRRKHLLRPRRGFYVIVPPQYASWGGPPPSWYIDDLMQHEERSYYVGLLKAAELHGASHQAVMEFQVVTDKRFSKIRAGRSLITFYYRKELVSVSEGVERRKTDTGSMKVSSVELTALDLLRYPNAAGGIDNIATVLGDLGDKIDPYKLAQLSMETERAVVQRLGYLLDRLGFREHSGAMFKTLGERGPLLWVELDRTEIRDPDFTKSPEERDERWRVIVRRQPEVDE